MFLKATLILKTFLSMIEEFLEIIFLDTFIFPQKRSVGYLDGIGQSFKTPLLSLLSLWFQVYIWNKLKLQECLRSWTYLVPRGLVLWMINSVDCFFNKVAPLHDSVVISLSSFWWSREWLLWEGQSQESVSSIGPCLIVQLLSKTIAVPHWWLCCPFEFAFASLCAQCTLFEESV